MMEPVRERREGRGDRIKKRGKIRLYIIFDFFIFSSRGTRLSRLIMILYFIVKI